MQTLRNGNSRVRLLLLLSLLLGLGLALHRTGKTTTVATSVVGQEEPEVQTSGANGRDMAPATSSQAVTQPSTGMAISRPTTVIDYSRQRVFRLVLEEGKCRLDAMEEVTGDFRPRRGLGDRHAGMITCRLVDRAGTTLAEESVHPADHICVVLDSNAGVSNPQATLLSGLGPQLFQVRFPAALAGEKLEVYRITQTQPSSVEQLLLSANLDQ